MDGERPELSCQSQSSRQLALEKLTSMNTKDLIIDDDTQSEEVEHVCKVVPHVRVPVFSRAFRIEAV
jgi:hypothetical protein